MESATIWDILTFLWESALGFLNNRIDILGLNFSLWEFALGMADLKKVYQAINEDEAMNALLEFKEKWQKTYPSCVKSWEDNWDILHLDRCPARATTSRSSALPPE